MAQFQIIGSGTVKLTDQIRNEDLKANAAVETTKLQQLHKPATNFALAIAATPVAREEIVFVAGTAGTIRNFQALLNESGTATDVDFDLKVNGVSVLGSLLNIVHGTGDRTVVVGTISSASLALGDVVSIQLITTSTTGAQGPFAWADISEGVQA